MIARSGTANPCVGNDARWTGVLEKRGGKWVIVQMHFSLASDKVRAEASPKETLQPASWSGTSSQKPSFEIEEWEKRLNKRQPPSQDHGRHRRGPRTK